MKPFTFCLLLLSLLLSGCEDLLLDAPQQRAATPIENLQNLSFNRGKIKPIRLQGKVIQRAPFLQGGAYLLQDESGMIWVVTGRELPPSGSELAIKGGPEQRQITLGSGSVGEIYVQELERIATTSP